MSDAVNRWVEQAWSTIESIPGVSDAVERERLRWNEFHNLDTLEVIVFGAYDAGKSSLLKRLLVDWRSSVPEWLTVSGRRETFESKRIEVGSLGLTDTPGLGSGNSEHDDVTLSAMRLADAYLWVLPPQLVTTGKEQFLEVIFGDAGIAEATIAVVARMDEAGVDPSDNESGFTDLCLRKKRELASVVTAALTTKNLMSVHCIVADPYQMVGNERDPDIEHYDIGRKWDGIEGLDQDIRALVKQRHDLRAQAGARFVRLLLNDIRDELIRLAEDLVLTKESIDNEVDRHATYEQRLDALQRQAQAELYRRVENALLSFSRSNAVGAISIRSLEEVLVKVVDEWSEESFTKYRHLAGELEVEVRERMASLNMDGFGRLAQETEDQEARAKGSRINSLKTGKKALAFGPALREAFEKYAAAELGMSLKVAAERLRKLESSGETVEAFIKSQGHSATFRGVKHAAKATQFVKWTNTLNVVGPLVEQLGSILLEITDEVITAKRAEEYAQQRIELRSQIQAETEKLKEAAAADFVSACDGLSQWLSKRLETIKSSLDSLSEQLKQIDESIDSIEDLIKKYP